MTPEKEAEIISTACRAAGLDTHIRWVDGRRQADTWAEQIAVRFKDFKDGAALPIKNSYMFCDTLDMCFFFYYAGVPQVAYAGYTYAGSADISEGKLIEAFRKADTVLRDMKRLAEEATS